MNKRQSTKERLLFHCRSHHAWLAKPVQKLCDSGTREIGVYGIQILQYLNNVTTRIFWGFGKPDILTILWAPPELNVELFSHKVSAFISQQWKLVVGILLSGTPGPEVSIINVP